MKTAMAFWNKIREFTESQKWTGTPLQPIELLSELKDTIEKERKIFREKTVIPDHYEIHLAELDMVDFKPIINSIARELSQEILRFARRKGYDVNTGEASVHFYKNRKITRGKVIVKSGFRPSPPKHKGDKSDSSAGKRTEAKNVWLKISPGEKEECNVSLFPGSNVVGRGSDADVQLPVEDRLASKHHFQISIESERVLLTDLNSANGLLCNQSPVRGTQTLASGDRLIAGATCIEVIFE
jgi:hypothetical protein